MKKEKKEVIDLYSKKRVADVFDKNRSRYAFQKYKHKFESKVLLKAINKTKKQNIKILDVGCGTGRFLPKIFSLDKNIEYFGLDTSKAMLEKLKQRADQLKKEVFIKKADATEIPFEDNTFDVVYTFHLLWHLPKEEQEKILLEMVRVTKKNGIILFDILNKKFIYEKIKKLKGKKETLGIYRLTIQGIHHTLGDKKFRVDKLNDVRIKNDFKYNIFNFLNKLNFLFPKSFFHMLYFTFKK